MDVWNFTQNPKLSGRTFNELLLRCVYGGRHLESYPPPILLSLHIYTIYIYVICILYNIEQSLNSPGKFWRDHIKAAANNYNDKPDWDVSKNNIYKKFCFVCPVRGGVKKSGCGCDQWHFFCGKFFFAQNPLIRKFYCVFTCFEGFCTEWKQK